MKDILFAVVATGFGTVAGTLFSWGLLDAPLLPSAIFAFVGSAVAGFGPFIWGRA